MNKFLWNYPNPFFINLVVSENDIDGLNHTNNAVYVKWCELVSWEHSASLGLGLDKFQELQRAMVIYQSEFKYLAPSFLGDKVQIATWILYCDQKLTLQRAYQAVRISDQATLLRGTTTFICVDFKTGKPKRMPKEFSENYGSSSLNLREN
jgi:acyl-CoA thioester hydrolase